MTHATTTIAVLKTVTLVLGGLITFYAVRAYRRTGAAALRSLAMGFGVVTAGALLAGIVDQLTGLPTNTALAIESALTAVGFGVILYSLFVD